MPVWLQILTLALAAAAVALAALSDRRSRRLRKRGERASVEVQRELARLRWAVRECLNVGLRTRAAPPASRVVSHAAAMEDLFALICLGDGPGTYLEVGAYDGLWHSNTALLEQLGWSGVLIEPIPSRAEECRRNRPGSLVVQAACVAPDGPASVQLNVVQERGQGEGKRSFVSTHPAHVRMLAEQSLATSTITVPAMTIADAVGDRFDRIDVAYVDVEVAELDLLRGFPLERLAVRLLIVEDNSYGHDRRVEEYLATRGYRPVGWISQNRVYVPQADAAFVQRVQAACPAQVPPAREPLWNDR